MRDAKRTRFFGEPGRLDAAGQPVARVLVPRVRAAAALGAAALGVGALLQPAVAVAAGSSWHFAVSGDSRNCGDVVMPSIAADARANDAAFYWHLGDARAIYDFDEDFRALHPAATIAEYLGTAWLDFQRNQIEPFGTTPFFLGIGNHELVAPKTRDEFVATFADWLDQPEIREQRLKDDAHDRRVRTYYHWMHEGVDFINLDNASPDQFDAAQLKWLGAVLQRDRLAPDVRALVVGMHEALPESLARGHSMSDVPIGQATGLDVYDQLLAVQKSKPVYVLASHSHFLMGGIFDTPYWRSHGGELPGWIVGTAGAFRYALPPGAAQATLARTHVYGYLLATVSGSGADRDNPIRFEFREMTQAAVPGDIVQRFGADLIRHCYQENAQN